MTSYRYHALGPLLAGEGSRAFLGLAVSADQRARPVVIVWVPEEAERDPRLLEGIQRETEHAASLDHPNIVTVLGFASLDEGHARVVEFADGESLKKVLATAGTLPVHLAAKVICDASTGVHYAHVAGNDDGSPLVHGDLRPRTLLVCFNGTTKVTGYGALAFASTDGKGPRPYSAPEQVLAGRRSMTLATDVYLLGLVLYECLTGQVPFADTPEGFDAAVLSAPFPAAPPGTIPPALEAVIRKACARKAEDRYPTPLALREAIEGALEGGLASAEELARTLEELFPQSHQLRADRRHTIDAGIADFIRRQWAEQEHQAPRPLPPPPPPEATAPPLEARPQAPRVVVGGRPLGAVHRVEPVPEAIEPEDEAAPAQSGQLPWLVALALFVAAIAGWWAWGKAHQPIPGVDRPAGSAPAPGPAPLAGVSPGPAPTTTPSTAAPTVDAGRASALDAGSRSVEAGAPDAGAASAAPRPDAGAPAEVGLSLETSPVVELLIDGRAVGRSPWSGMLPPGRKVITLSSKELGINTTRAVVLRSERVVEQIVLEKGSVVVTAPEGAVVFIDGIRVGVAPLSGEVPVYEGHHRILVTVGQSKWTDTFNLLAHQKVSFNVEVE
jgi:eukaryotic-like serine/threonine-protein kinase